MSMITHVIKKKKNHSRTNNNTVMNTSEAIYMLLDGASPQDFEHLDDVEMRTMVLMLSNIVKQLVNG